MIFILTISAAITGLISLVLCYMIVKYIKLSVEIKNIKAYLKKITNIVSSARYGNLCARLDVQCDIAPELSKNLNNLLESILDRDIMIKEYIQKEKEDLSLKEDFIATLTHDLKVPIIAQDNTFDLFLTEKFGCLSSLQKEVIAKLKTSNIDLKYLVEALLETYKAEHDGIIVKKEAGICINKFVLEIINQLSSIFEMHNKKIVFSTGIGDDFCAEIDIFLVKRVVNNLILNALSYSANSDRIEVSIDYADVCENDSVLVGRESVTLGDKNTALGVVPKCNVENVGGGVFRDAAFGDKEDVSLGIMRKCSLDGVKYREAFSISIRDYGIGIEKEEIDKIFNKYYCGKSRLIKSSTGLGLYLSNKIIKALGGKCIVTSAKNEGSTFTVVLPK